MLPPARVVELITPIVRALVCAHEHGIVHRDLKPENIYLTALLACALSAPPTARAEPDAEDAEDAEDAAGVEPKPWSRDVPRYLRLLAMQHLREGNRLINIPLFDNAAESYRAAIRLWPHPAFYFNLAIAQINLVQPAEAYLSLERALAYGARALAPGDLAQAENYHRRLSGQLGHIAIECAEAGAVVRLDGRVIVIGPGRYEGVVLPGEHQLVAEKAGRIPDTRTMVLSAGQRAEETITLKRPLRTVTERYMPAWVPWATLAASAALAAGGRVVQRRGDEQAVTFNQLFGDLCGRGCNDENRAAVAPSLAAAERHQRNALQLYIGGAALAVSAAALLYLNRERVVRREVVGGERR